MKQPLRGARIPEHREVQRLGREKWLSEFRITVCDSVRDYSFKA